MTFEYTVLTKQMLHSVKVPRLMLLAAFLDGIQEWLKHLLFEQDHMDLPQRLHMWFKLHNCLEEMFGKILWGHSKCCKCKTSILYIKLMSCWTNLLTTWRVIVFDILLFENVGKMLHSVARWLLLHMHLKWSIIFFACFANVLTQILILLTMHYYKNKLMTPMGHENISTMHYNSTSANLGHQSS